MRFITLAVCALLSTAPVFAQDVVPTSSQQIKMTYAPVVKAVAPAVVNVYSKQTVQGGANNPFANDPLFAPFFQQFAPAKKRVQQSLGSGFIASGDGLIVTNAHVIRNSEEIMVGLTDGRQLPARAVLVDQPSDLALLRIDAKGTTLPTLTLSDSETLEVGDLVLAVGDPFGVGQTVTSGIVSALARSNTDINDFDFFIQTDAAINPGNSGGPLVDMDGRVVGVNSAIYSRSGGNLGIGFAIPADMVRAVIAAEKSGQVGKRGVVRPWLGFKAQSMTQDVAASLGFDRAQGALVADVVKGGPGEKAGLKTGDVIIGLGNYTLRDYEELRYRIATMPIGQQTTLKVRRAGQDVMLTFTAERPAEIPAKNPVTIVGKNPLEGATLINVSPAVVEDMGLANQTEGVVVQSVKAGTIGARLGLEPGDGIIAVANKPITSSDQVQALLPRPADGRWIIKIRRSGRDKTLILN